MNPQVDALARAAGAALQLKIQENSALHKQLEELQKKSPTPSPLLRTLKEEMYRPMHHVTHSSSGSSSSSSSSSDLDRAYVSDMFKALMNRTKTTPEISLENKGRSLEKSAMAPSEVYAHGASSSERSMSGKHSASWDIIPEEARNKLVSKNGRRIFPATSTGMMHNQSQDSAGRVQVFVHSGTYVDPDIVRTTEQTDVLPKVVPADLASIGRHSSTAEIKAIALAQLMTGQRDVGDMSTTFWSHNAISMFPKDFTDMFFDTMADIPTNASAGVYAPDDPRFSSTGLPNSAKFREKYCISADKFEYV